MAPRKDWSPLARLRRTCATYEAARSRRDQAILYALEHHSIREVAKASGLSPARVHQIQHGR